MTDVFAPGRHIVFCYTGIHSFAGAIMLRRCIDKPVTVHLTSSREILADLRGLHRQWHEGGRRGLETVCVLGPLTPQSVLDDRSVSHQAGQGWIADLLAEMGAAGVRIEVLNEYETVATLHGRRVGHHLAQKPSKEHPQRPMLAGMVAKLYGPLDEDPLDMLQVLKQHELGLADLENRAPLILAMEWTFVETLQYRRSEPLQELVDVLGSTQGLDSTWLKRASIQKARGRGVLMGSSYRKPLEQALQISRSDLPVIVLGETGTGKEMMARRIHDASDRWADPFVATSCANFTESLFEAELFGASRGAYTGSEADRPGLLETAHKGTLFLDEIGELSMINQGKLLRVLQEKRYRRLGETRERAIDIRLIAATNEDLYARARNGTFRLDLWYRLAGEVIRLPPLREIPSDLHDIAQHLLIQLSNDDSGLLKLRREKFRIPQRLSRDVTKCLPRHSWPGNVRELRQAIHRHLITGRSLESIVEDLIRQEASLNTPEAVVATEPAQSTGPFVENELVSLKDLNSRYIEWARSRIEAHNPRAPRKELAKVLDVSTETLRKHFGS